MKKRILLIKGGFEDKSLNYKGIDDGCAIWFKGSVDSLNETDMWDYWIYYYEDKK